MKKKHVKFKNYGNLPCTMLKQAKDIFFNFFKNDINDMKEILKKLD